MKTTSLRRATRGFSLIELLAVVSIIVVLAGIVIGALLQSRKGQDKKKTRVTINRASLELERYFNDNQYYPVSEDVFSEVLYTSLSGDYTGRGEGEPEGFVYWKELLVKDLKDNPDVGQRNGRRIIMDAYGQSLRYRCALDSEGNPDAAAKNADFDLWSIGPDGEPSGDNIESTLQNEQTLDDIWN